MEEGELVRVINIADNETIAAVKPSDTNMDVWHMLCGAGWCVKMVARGDKIFFAKVEPCCK